MRSALAVLLLAYTSLTYAETWLTLGFTNHAKDKRYCEVHPGVSHEWRWRDLRTFVGAHQNSHCEASLVGGAAYLPFRYGRFSFGATAMVLTYDKEVIPAAAPAISYDRKGHGVDLVAIPGVLVHLRYRWSF